LGSVTLLTMNLVSVTYILRMNDFENLWAGHWCINTFSSFWGFFANEILIG
jgi:hypothetical protein